METIKWENANALEIGMLMEMAEDGYVFWHRRWKDTGC